MCRTLINLSLKDENSNFSRRKKKKYDKFILPSVTVDERAYVIYLEMNLSMFYTFKNENDYLAEI